MTFAVDKPVEGHVTDARPHPAGRKGALLSLNECAERAWKARMSIRLRAWALKQLAECGVSRGSRKEWGQCILDAYRKAVPYVNDPVMGEFMATPDQLLCLDDGGLCMMGGDCDEAAITLTAAMLTLGVPAMIVGSSHKEPYDTPTHVFMAFQDEFKRWVRMDGTTKHAAGQTPHHAREWWVEPGKEAKDRGEGDFVGMTETGLSGVPDFFDFRYPGLR